MSATLSLAWLSDTHGLLRVEFAETGSAIVGSRLRLARRAITCIGSVQIRKLQMREALEQACAPSLMTRSPI